MLDPGALPDRHILEKVQDDAASFDDHPLDPEVIEVLASPLVNHLYASGTYHGDEERRPVTAAATMAREPALIQRRRDAGLVKVLDAIGDHASRPTVVPEDILPLVYPDHAQATTHNPQPGAVLDIDGYAFSPTPSTRPSDRSWIGSPGTYRPSSRAHPALKDPHRSRSAVSPARTEAAERCHRAHPS